MADRRANKTSLAPSSRKRARSQQVSGEVENVSMQQMQHAAETAEAAGTAVAAVVGVSSEQQVSAAVPQERRSARTRTASRKQQAAAAAGADSAEEEDEQEQERVEVQVVSKRSRRSTVQTAASQSGATAAADDSQEAAASGRSSRGKAAGYKSAKASSGSKASKGKASSSSSGPTRAAEQRLWQEGYKLVAGVDEAGRGPLAGPVVAAAAILPSDIDFPGLNDSKQMTEEDRDRLYDLLTTHPDVRYAVSVVDHEMIDEINILQAAMLAMQQAVEGLSCQPDHLLIDGNRRPKGLPEDLPAQLLVKGDATSTCIAAASVIAKVTRDRLMLELDRQYPLYGFAQHKGYGVPAHRAAIHQHGPCAVHRRSFEPVKSMVGFAGYGQRAKAAALVAAAAAEETAATAAKAAAGALTGTTADTELGEEVDITALVAAAAAAAGGSSELQDTAAAAAVEGVLTEVRPSSAGKRGGKRRPKKAASGSKKGRKHQPAKAEVTRADPSILSLVAN